VSLWLSRETALKGSIHTSCRRSNYYTYLPLGCGSKTPLISVGLYLKGLQVFPS
jgi:hypothetical protein